MPLAPDAAVRDAASETGAALCSGGGDAVAIGTSVLTGIPAGLSSLCMGMSVDAASAAFSSGLDDSSIGIAAVL